MQIDTEAMFLDAVKNGIRDCLKTRLQYSDFIDRCLHDPIVTTFAKELFQKAFETLVTDQEFRAGLVAELKQAIAKTLVKRFGGEIEATVNRLKSDPVTRARIVLALEQIVQ